MKKSILSLSLAFLGLGAITTSCEDMLTPDMDRYATEFTGTDSINFYLGIVRNMQGMVEQNVLLGDLRSDLVSPTEYVADSVSNIVNFSNLQDGESAILNRAAYYKVINQCNFYLDKVDSLAMKNNSYFMRRELAQVELMRAWTYMQLVQNYGKVPFITRPVDNASTGWESNPPEGWADADNLISLLDGVEGQSLSQAYAYAQTYGYPKYGNFNNGFGNFSQDYLIFNADLVMGDLYLLRGAGKTDYEQAAYHYHRYLNNDCEDYVSGRARVAKLQRGDEEPTYYMSTSWGMGLFYSLQWGSRGDIRTAIPSAANTFFGKVLTSIPQIYGFDPSSGAHTNTTTSEDGKENTTTSGQISVTANYKSRQLEPSPAYESLCYNQAVPYNEMSILDFNTQIGVEYPASLYDKRLDNGAPKVATDIGRIRFVSKYCGSISAGDIDYLYPSSFNFRYGIPLYRTRQIYLKYAEAINRAGFPRHAFAILRDGLTPEKLPTIGLITAKADTVWTTAPDIATDPDDKGDLASVTITYDVVADSAAFLNAGANCIDLNELYRATKFEWLNFENFELKRNVGIHAAGCGEFTNWDTEFTYENMVSRRILQERERSGQTLSSEHPFFETIAAVAGNTKNTNRDLNGLKDYYDYTENVNSYNVYGAAEDEISAVETLIADEMALELAFEGTRYYDLMRIARHRNAAGQDGTAWMAWLISRRDLGLAPYEQPATVGSLFSYLNDVNNWYLPAPRNK